MTPVQFRLKDADGDEHLYETTPHPATEGARILWRLTAIGLEPLGKAAAGLLAAEGVTLRSLAGMLDDPAALRALDLGGIAASLRHALATVPMDQLTADVLSHTCRDGKQLRNPGHFDAAYSANYLELQRALWEVVKLNRFLPLPG